MPDVAVRVNPNRGRIETPGTACAPQQVRASFVAIGEVGWQAPLHRDGYITDADISALADAGAVGEITGWSFDAKGRPLEGPVNQRVAGLPLEIPPKRLTVVVGAGPQKVAPLKAALTGRLASALVADEATAKALVADEP